MSLICDYCFKAIEESERIEFHNMHRECLADWCRAESEIFQTLPGVREILEQGIKMKPARYIFVNKDLDMSPGKMAAQVAHAEMYADVYQLRKPNPNRRDSELFDYWYERGCTKLVMEARDAVHLLMIREFLDQNGYKTFLVIDEGRTEIAPHSPTALSVELVDKDDERVQQDFADFRTFKKPKNPGKGEISNSSPAWPILIALGAIVLIVLLVALFATPAS